MSLATITINAIEEYVSAAGASLFTGLLLPTGIDRDTVIDTILLKTSNFESLYTNPEYLRNAINVWSRKHQRTFDKWITALNIEYNPLENYDRIEDWTDSVNGTTSNTNNANKTSNGSISGETHNAISNTSDGTNTDSSSNTGSSNTENKVSAYDSNTYENQNKTDSSNSATTSGESNTHIENTQTADNTSGQTTVVEDITTITDNGTHNNTSTHVGRVHGNIGVLTADKMLSDHLELMYWSIYEHIADMFIEEFCIMVY